MRNVHSYDKNFAQIAEGASVETFYGQELHSLRHHEGDGGIFQTIISDLRALFGLSRSYACNLLSAELDPLKYVQFKGHRAGVVIRMVAPVAIHTVVYDHVLTDLRDSRLSRAAPRTMNVYVKLPPLILSRINTRPLTHTSISGHQQRHGSTDSPGQIHAQVEPQDAPPAGDPALGAPCLLPAHSLRHCLQSRPPRPHNGLQAECVWQREARLLIAVTGGFKL